MKSAAAGTVEATLIVVREKSGKKVMASFRIDEDLLKELVRIAKKENVAKVQLLEGWLRAGIEDYRANGIKKV